MRAVLRPIYTPMRASIRGAVGVAIGVAIALTVLAWSTTAHAYPQMQLTTGASRCNQCHFAPGGGGLLTSYGRDAVGDELSTFEGNGAFLHGAIELPSPLALGAEVRGAFISKDVQDPSGSRQAFFPMQADLLARVALPAGLSAYATAGLRGRVRDGDDIVPDSNFQPIHASRLISREHWLMWREGTQGFYGRAGRFYAPYGLRFAEHILYVRRDLGFNQLEEAYGVSGGLLRDPWEVHVTAYAPDFVRQIGSEEGGVAAYVERRLLDDRLAVAVQGKYGVGRGMNRLIGGLVGKYYAESIKTLFLAETNVLHLDPDRVQSRAQFIGIAGFSLLPVRGLMLTALAERNQVDIKVRDAAWSAFTGLVSWFPYPHFELQLMGRVQLPAGGDPAPVLLVQLHYFM